MEGILWLHDNGCERLDMFFQRFTLVLPQLYHPLAPGPELGASFLCVIMGSLKPKVSMMSCQVSMSIDKIA
jgi:hypothetical protein